MKYKSKVDLWALIVTIVFGALLIFTAVVTHVWGQWYWFVIVAVFYSVVVLPVYFRTFYVLTDTDLILNQGLFMWSHKIPLKNILELNKVRGITDSVALSIDCIEVIYYKGKLMQRVLIAPEDRTTFWKEISEHVEVDTA